jgi:hypothetical protein
MLNKILEWFINIWLGLIVLLTAVDFIGIFMRAETTLSGLGEMWSEIWNYRLYTTILIFSVPAMLAAWWLQKRATTR